MSRALATRGGRSNSVDSFLNHRTRERSGGYLSWRDQDPPRIDTWMHTKVVPFAVWQHWFPKLVVRDKDGESTTKLVPGQFVCREEEKVLVAQHRRKDDGTRVRPPVSCPFCRLIETVRDMIDEGKLDWLEEVFRFETDDETRIIHAGGLCGLFKDDDLDEKQKKQMAKKGIKPREAFKENMYARCSYVFAVVDNAHPESGVQIATESQLLGDKVKEVINDTIESLEDAEAGDPFKTPYCVRWIFNPDKGIEFQKKYKARRMEKVALTEDIRELIYSEEPDLSHITDPLGLKLTRSLMEKHCVAKLPWEWIFDVKEGVVAEPDDFPPKDKDDEDEDKPRRRASAKSKKDEDEDDDEDVKPRKSAAKDDDEDDDDEEEEKESRPSKAKPKKAAAKAEEDDDEDGDEEDCPICEDQDDCPHVGCNECGKPILPTDPVCEHCGHVYKKVKKAAEPEPSKGRKRGSARESGDDPQYG